jgi:hypothetical protein
MRHLVISTYGSRILHWHTIRKDGSVIQRKRRTDISRYDLINIDYMSNE